MVNYTTVANVQAILSSIIIGVTGSNLYTDTAITYALTRIDAEINARVNLTANETAQPWASVFAGIEEDIIAMHVTRAKYFKENNLLENVTSFWSIVPSFTKQHQLMFSRYMNQHSNSYAHNYSMNDGSKLQ